MKTFLRVAIATFAMVGIAAAQPAPPPKADPAKKEPPKADPAAKADPKAGGAKMEMPKPPAEVGELGKMMTGTWKCKGEETDMAGAKAPITGSVKAKVDLDKWWLTETIDVKGAKMTMKMMAFTTYDASSKKWRRVSVDNMGGQIVGTSDGMKDNKMDWNMDTMGPMGAGMFRDHVDASDAKAGMKMWGEMSMDKGKTWTKVYEWTCKK